MSHLGFPPEFPPSKLVPLVEEVANLLKSRGETVSVAETAAGGIISASLLSAGGASKFYAGGLTLYTLPSRIAFAGWTQDDTDSYRGPTPAIAQKLAENVRSKLNSTYTICESGTAGPTGGETRNRTPGYVALAVATPERTFTRVVETGSKDRNENMILFAEAALKLYLDVIKGEGEAKAKGSGGNL